MHAQHFVDNQTIHRGHRSSPFVFRSQVVYRHTDSDLPCEHTPAFSFDRVPVWGLQRKARSAERLQAEKRALRVPLAYIKDRKSARQIFGRPSRRYRSRRFFRENIAAVLVWIRSVAADPA